MVQAGACGYLVKKSALDELEKAIITVVNKGIYFNEIMTPELYKNAKDKFDLNKNISGVIFNPIEEKVGRCLSKGMNYEQTGIEVGKSATSIPKYKYDIKKKIGTDNDFDIPRFFLKHKLILLSEL